MTRMEAKERGERIRTPEKEKARYDKRKSISTSTMHYNLIKRTSNDLKHKRNHAFLPVYTHHTLAP